MKLKNNRANELFSIGELAKYQNISKQTLIFYDKIGLFCPAYVDPDNGYRYYSAQQLDFLDTILIMKKIGFSLEEIREHMKNSNLENSLRTLNNQVSVIDRQLAELQLIKSRLLHRCGLLETAMHCSPQTVSVETVQEQWLYFREVEAPYTLTEISIATKKCFAGALEDRLPIFFESGVVVPLERIRDGRYTEASRAFLPIEYRPGLEHMERIPAGRCVTAHHFGDYESIGETYRLLLSHCRERGISICSDSYEFCINDYITSSDETEFITKILFYIEE